MATIILTGGGTAGHCIPALSLIPYLKDNFENIYYIGSENGIEKNIVKSYNIKYYSISTVKLIRKFNLKNFLIPFTLLSAIRKSKKLLKKLKPDVIFSKGGYVALPTVIAAKTLKIPVISHESDYSIGLANKISARYSNLLLTSFEDTAKLVKNGKYIGPPIRTFKLIDREKAKQNLLLHQNKKTILIMGGSLGAKYINDIVYSCLDKLLLKYNIIHICGKNNIKYKSKMGYYCVEYTNDIDMLFSATDYVIMRGGSNALFEVLSLNIPSIIIPLPKEISRGDQIENANYFTKKGLILLLNQENLTIETLIKNIKKLENKEELIKNNIKRANIKSSSKKIANLLYEHKN